ncbi:MAG TPA: serine hydrolase domain-containing protein [Candidatus Limnocylindrales bacterium]|nr:serine hydrolase domain-containing protein [Candidatus Limnocylindrales bacterium]
MSVVVEPVDDTTREVGPARLPPGDDVQALEAWLDGVVHRHSVIGIAAAVIKQGQPSRFASRGLASIAERRPATEDTVFRIASVTKLVTAIAVMQLVERGLVDLDAPANDALRAYRLVIAKPGHRPATLRHLLTHTAGIPEVVHLRDVFHPGWGPFMSRPAIASVAIGEPLPSLRSYYGAALRCVVEPGTVFAYSNHGFATLGQVLEDVTGEPLDRLYRERIFEPLGMVDTDFARSARMAARRATGYEFGRRGPEPVADRLWLGSAGGGIYSTARDLARLGAALLESNADGAAAGGRILETGSLAALVAPSFQPVPQLPGVGLGCFRGDVDGHPTFSHDGLLPGFAAILLVAPDDGTALVAMTTGAPGAHSWLPVEIDGLLRELLGLPASEEKPHGSFPQHPERWPDLCGRYALPPRISDLRGRLGLAGVDVGVRGGRLTATIRTPIPGLSRTFELLPDDPDDPDVFRVDLRPLGVPMTRVVFARGPGRRPIAAYTDLLLQVFQKVPAERRPRPWLGGALGALAVAAALRAARGRAHAGEETSP